MELLIVNCNLCNSNKVYKKFNLTEFDVLQCKSCDLVFLSHIPDEEELIRLYSSDYYLKREKYYFDNIVTNPESGKFDENIEAFSSGLEKLNSLKPGKGKLLDIGCGLGIFLNMAKEDGWDTCGVDVSPYAVQYAKEKFGLDAHNSGVLGNIEFPSDNFDVVTLWDSLEHFPDPLGQFREIHRVLKKEGLVMLNVPNEASLLRTIAKYLYITTGRLLKYPVRKLYHNYHLYYFDMVAARTLLKKGGFETLLVEKKTIPTVKARGSSLEKGVVKFVSYLEKSFGMEYELRIIAKKVTKPCDQE